MTATDPRLHDVLGRALSAGETPVVSILGFPCDQGVTRNNGRAGAAAGPTEIRKALGRLTPDAEAPDQFLRVAERTADLGDVDVTGDLEHDQDRLAQQIEPVLASKSFLIVLGGGHETTYGHFLGYVRASIPVTLVNWDAHPDVREPDNGRGTSGTPFRQALEHSSGIAQRYAVAGLRPQSVAAEHLRYVRARGEAVWRKDVTPATAAKLFGEPRTSVLASFDLDAVDRAHAPGVSAPNTGGLGVDLWLEAAYRAGHCAMVRSADVVELNPAFDRDGQTAALAALTVWCLLKGVSDRLAGAGRPPTSAT